MVLNLAGVDWLALGVDAGGDHVGTLVHVGEQKIGAYAGLDPKTRNPTFQAKISHGDDVSAAARKATTYECGKREAAGHVEPCE
ncbi:hypothetical protein K1719_045766 [Acacia pycnantha]|nr:hypothetical protein K1719_045766 [Acacia pycnantha]